LQQLQHSSTVERSPGSALTSSPTAFIKPAAVTVTFPRLMSRYCFTLHRYRIFLSAVLPLSLAIASQLWLRSLLNAAPHREERLSGESSTGRRYRAVCRREKVL
ncbi:hypothetical protein RRG08_062050, partial [Elysia crispata]